MNLMRRPKLCIAQQIEHMKTKNIKFDIMSEEEALSFLSTSNYYFKVKAYRKNYIKDVNGYRYLDFAYLVELSKIDSYLRKEILLLSLDVEHYLKTKLMCDISNNENEDGYSIVEWYCNNHATLRRDIKEKSKNSACTELVAKYEEEYAVWHFMELLSFGDFIDFYNSYYAKNNTTNAFKPLLRPIKFLRNAAAHNNCLINNLSVKDETFTPTDSLNTRIGKIPGIQPKALHRNMGNKIIHDFVALIVVYNEVASPNARVLVMERLATLFNERISQNAEYFVKNQTISSSYKFVKKVVDNYLLNAYNVADEQKTI